ncbi:Uncharacterized protein SCF082_LOCUS20279 [Durusdinium trenchii]|uniref:Uncharacterized protein n=1 Tax=Durusdinium trenchii TaxID=1381693 RepID=A0ABP0L1B6_9DINO
MRVLTATAGPGCGIIWVVQGTALSARALGALRFREVFRFYLGHKPTQEQFQTEWAKLDCCGNQKVDLTRYITWLQTSTNPIFRQHAPPDTAEEPKETPRVEGAGKYLPRVTFSKSQIRPKWNQRFNAGVNKNERCPQGQRSYFSKTQSLPELQRQAR